MHAYIMEVIPEEQQELKANYAKGYARPWIRTSVLISPEFYDLAKKYHIKFGEALRMGLSIKFADLGIKDYDNNLNLFRRLQSVLAQLEDISQKYYDLKDRVEIEEKHAQSVSK